MTTAQDGGKVVSYYASATFTPRKFPVQITPISMSFRGTLDSI